MSASRPECAALALGVLLAYAAAAPAAGQQAGAASADTVAADAHRLPGLVVAGWSLGAEQGARSLSRDEWERQPQPGEDAFRMVSRLPGVAANDLSARFSVRGGGHDEVQVRLDGLELVEPFHLREIEGGALAIVDPAVLGAVELVPGGAPAEYGGHLTGVLEMRTAPVPADGARAAAGLSLTGARVLAQRRFGGGRGDWLATARRGFLDVVLDRVDEQAGAGDAIVPRYGDAMAKVRWRVGDTHVVSLHGLYAADSFRARDGELLARTGYGNRYAWANWHLRAGRGLHVHTVVSAGDLDWDREGRWDGGRVGERVSDRRWLRFGAVRQAWELSASSRWGLRWGWSARRSTARYDYARAVDVGGAPDSVRVALRPSADEAGAWAAGRVSPWDALTLEAGARYDRHSGAGGHAWSPRMSAALALGPATTLRAAWGIHRQAQGVHALRVQDGETALGPPERAEHRTLGVEHATWGVLVRVDAYQRILPDPRPRWVSLDRALDVFPEAEDDRVRLAPERAEARGVELFARGTGEGRLRWWASYALARMHDRYAGVEREVPRETDQRHTVRAGASYVSGPAWRVSAAWEWHSGLPITARAWQGGGAGPGADGWVPGELYGERLAAYHRLDVRASRSWQTRHGRVSAFVDLFNLYGRRNDRAYSYSFHTGPAGTEARREVETLLPLVPSAGVSLEL